MSHSQFCFNYLTIHILSLVYLLTCFFFPSPTFSITSTSLFILITSTFTRLLFLSAFYHRWGTHDAFHISSPILRCFAIILSSLTGYGSINVWAKRHRTSHTHPHRHGSKRLTDCEWRMEWIKRYKQQHPHTKHIPSPPMKCTECHVTWHDITMSHWKEPVYMKCDDKHLMSCLTSSHTWTPFEQRLDAASSITCIITTIFHVLCYHLFFPHLSFIHLITYTTLFSHVITRFLSTGICDHTMSIIRGGWRMWYHPRHVSMSCNSIWYNIILMGIGEGWMDHHHACPRQPQYGMAWWQIDLTYIVIRILSIFHLITLQHQHLLTSQGCTSCSSIPIPHTSNHIYIGSVVHTRLQPFYTHFMYRVFYMYTEICQYGARETTYAWDPFWLWSAQRKISRLSFCVATFRPCSYLSVSGIASLLSRTTLFPSTWLTSPDTQLRVMLLTNFRYMGFTFNPISYYFIYRRIDEDDDDDDDGDKHDKSIKLDDIYHDDIAEYAYYNTPLHADSRYQLIAMVSEVHNTPWGQTTYYVHPIHPQYRIPLQGENDNMEDVLHKHVSLPYYDVAVKKMHVSPFFGMHYRYQVRYNEPTDRWNVRWQLHSQQHIIDDKDVISQDQIQNHTSVVDTSSNVHPTSTTSSTGTPDVHFKASMSMHGHPITQSNLIYVLWAFPLQTIKIVFCIYGHAAVMFVFRRAKVYGHPDPDVKFWD